MVQIFEREKIFHLFTEEVSYILQVEGNSVRNLYFGEAIDGADAGFLLSPNTHSSFDTELRAEREEYPLWNGHGFHLPCLRAQGESGRAVFAVFAGYEQRETP
jgi:hypothetical protein